ncbi:LOW QUALITY PROTEIN: hypothetical protein MC885_009042 [Smutsia gigantea]|nr:LOW QUALITY PROTEIN: hypothetical protein MC885_009042 [Smutsia gigantea]
MSHQRLEVQLWPPLRALGPPDGLTSRETRTRGQEAFAHTHAVTSAVGISHQEPGRGGRAQQPTAAPSGARVRPRSRALGRTTLAPSAGLRPLASGRGGFRAAGSLGLSSRAAQGHRPRGAHSRTLAPTRALPPPAAPSFLLEASDMLKPGDPGGSAFLKVDPAYLQHWQQLFPHGGGGGPLKGGGAAGPLGAPQPLQPPPPPPPERVEPPPDSLRPRPASLSSASSTPASSSTSVSSASCAAAAAAALAGLSALPVAQLPVFAPLAAATVAAEPLPPKDLCLSAASGPGPSKCGAGGDGRGASRFRCSAEELDYYLYGQQRMEIIPLNQHTSDPNNRT